MTCDTIAVKSPSVDPNTGSLFLTDEIQTNPTNDKGDCSILTVALGRNDLFETIL